MSHEVAPRRKGARGGLRITSSCFVSHGRTSPATNKSRFPALRYGSGFGVRLASMALCMYEVERFNARRELRCREQIRLGRTQADAAKIAASDAAEAVFQNESRFGSALAGIKKPFGVAGDIAVPFVKTPGAIAGKAAEYSVGVISSPRDLARVFKASAGGDEAALMEAQKQLVERFGRNVTGALALGLGYELAQRGLMTGSSPESKAERDQQGLEGKMPGSILIGVRWYSISTVAPLANVMILGADFYHRSQDPELSMIDAGKAAIAGVGRQTVDLSSMRGVQDILDVVKNPAQAGRYLQNTAASFVPTGVAQVARMVDDKVKEPKTVEQSILSRVPFASRTVPSRIDQLGREVERDNVSRATSLIDPFATRAAATDLLIKEMESVGVDIPKPTKKAEESDAEYRQRLMNVGAEIRSALTRLIATERYQRAEKEEQSKMMSDATRNIRASYTRRRKKGLNRRAE